MSTIKIGNEFEKKIFRLFSDELKQGRLLFNPECCQIFHKKGYYSKDRKKNIIVDISLEVTLPGQDKWSILLVVECKNYNHSIPVDDIEEFNSKLLQIAGANVKGIIVSTNSFQEGAVNYASARGMGLARMLNNNNLQWILTRALTGLISFNQIEKSRVNIYEGLTDENYINEHIDFYGNFGDKFTHSLNQLMELLFENEETKIQRYYDLLINNENNQTVFVPFIQKERIEELSVEILDRYHSNDIEAPIKLICDNLERENNIKFLFEKTLGTDALGFEILGKISLTPSTVISISSDAHTNPFRLKFTIAHELGHFYLNHFEYMYAEYYSEKDYENEIPSFIKIEDIKRLEWQANYFASCLLLPKEKFVKEFLTLICKEEIKNRGYGILFVDNQECNLNNFYMVTNKLRDLFKVSRKVIEIRLKNLDLLTDWRNKNTL